jgi:hypothetical protein
LTRTRREGVGQRRQRRDAQAVAGQARRACGRDRRGPHRRSLGVDT